MADVKTPPRIFVVILVLLLGQGSWIGINSIWVELPLLVSLGIPEQFEITSWLVIILQLANIGPLIFMILNYLTPKGFHLEVSTNYVISAMGTIVCIFLIFFWDVYTLWSLDGKVHSTYLTIFTFILAMVDCTSNVTFLPFMARLKSHYMTWFFIGMSLSSVIPSVVAIIQGVGGAPNCAANYTYTMINETDSSFLECTSWMYETKPARFGPEVFYSFLSLMMFACFVASICLNHLPAAKREYAPEYISSHKQCPPQGSDANGGGGQYEMVPSDREATDHQEINIPKVVIEPENKRPLMQYVFLFLFLGLSNALVNSVLPAIQSFSAGSYGLNIYLIAAILGNFANSVACFIVMIKPFKSIPLVFTVFTLGTITGCYCFITALMSPSPPLQHSLIGEILVVLCWFVSSACLHFVRATIGWIMRTEPNNRVLLITYGVINQVGSLVGAFIIFPVVHYTDWFVPYYPDPCADRPDCVVVS